jgi:hypothetical protein
MRLCGQALGADGDFERSIAFPYNLRVLTDNGHLGGFMPAGWASDLSHIGYVSAPAALPEAASFVMRDSRLTKLTFRVP